VNLLTNTPNTNFTFQQLKEKDMEIKNINIEDIDYSYIENCRTSIEVEDLRESIEATGLQTPIGVVLQGEGKFGLVYGFRRLNACSSLGWDTIPASIVSADNQADLLVMNLQENVSRQSLTPMEEAYAIKRIIDAGKDVDEFRAALGWSKTLITQRLGLLELSLEIQEALEEGKISVNQARAIDEAEHEHHGSLIVLAEEGTTVKSLKEEIEQLNRVISPDDEVTLVLDEDNDLLLDDEEDYDSSKEDAKALAEANSNLVKATLLDCGAKVLIGDSSWWAYQVAISSIDFSRLPSGELAAFVNAIQNLAGDHGLDAWGEGSKR
jgi:ParB family transcriptional regulator, chromosome partitioning protein